jgi:hypothetical protein
MDNNNDENIEKIVASLEFCSSFFKAYFSKKWRERTRNDYVKPFKDIGATKKNIRQYLFFCSWYMETFDSIQLFQTTKAYSAQRQSLISYFKEKFGKVKWMSFEVMHMCVYFESLEILESYIKIVISDKQFAIATFKLLEYSYLFRHMKDDEVLRIIQQHKCIKTNTYHDEIDKEYKFINGVMLEALVYFQKDTEGRLLTNVRHKDVCPDPTRLEKIPFFRQLAEICGKIYLCGPLVFELLLNDKYEFRWESSYHPLLTLCIELHMSSSSYPEPELDTKEETKNIIQKVMTCIQSHIPKSTLRVVFDHKLRVFHIFDTTTGKSFVQIFVFGFLSNTPLPCLEKVFINFENVYCTRDALLVLKRKKIFVGHSEISNTSAIWKMKDFLQFYYMWPLYAHNKMYNHSHFNSVEFDVSEIESTN